MILAIETATSVGSVAILDDAGVRTETLGAQRDHAKHLASRVAALVDGNFKGVTGYALSIGPGSFTGLRVGLAFLKGLAVVNPRPAVGVNTLRVIAEGVFQQHAQTKHALAVLDARKGEVFAAMFDRAGRAVLEVGVYSASTLAERVRSDEGVFVAGDALSLDLGANPTWTVADEATFTPTAADLVRLAKVEFDAERTVDPQALEPLYMQVSGAEQSLANGTLSVKGRTRGV